MNDVLKLFVDGMEKWWQAIFTDHFQPSESSDGTAVETVSQPVSLLGRVGGHLCKLFGGKNDPS